MIGGVFIVTRLPSFSIVEPNPIVGIPRESRYGVCIPFSSTCTPSLAIRSAIKNGVIGRILFKNARYVLRAAASASFSAWRSARHSLYCWILSGTTSTPRYVPPVTADNPISHKICADKFGYFFANADSFFGFPCLVFPTFITASLFSNRRKNTLSIVVQRANVNSNWAPPAANHADHFAAPSPIIAAASANSAAFPVCPASFFARRRSRTYSTGCVRSIARRNFFAASSGVATICLNFSAIAKFLFFTQTRFFSDFRTPRRIIRRNERIVIWQSPFRLVLLRGHIKASPHISAQHHVPSSVFQTLNFIRSNSCGNLLCTGRDTLQTFPRGANGLLHRQGRICRNRRRRQISHRQCKFWWIFICTYQLKTPRLFTKIYYITNKD